jgi:hypothetical protein
MYGNFNHFVAAEQINDKHRAAAQSRQAAELTKTQTREPRERRSPVMSRSWIGLRRRPKVA